MDTSPITARSLQKPYHVKGDEFERAYKEHLSDFRSWKHREHAQKWLVFPKNIGPNLSIDETALSNGDLYTIVSNKDAHGRKGALVAIVSGTKEEVDALNSLVYARTDLIKITSVLSQKADEGASFSSPPALACQHHYAFHLFICVHCMRWKRSVLRKLLAL